MIPHVEHKNTQVRASCFLSNKDVDTGTCLYTLLCKKVTVYYKIKTIKRKIKLNLKNNKVNQKDVDMEKS